MAAPSFCIIPVRGGSKGLPRKNLADFGGVSLLERTINQAKDVFAPEHIFVTTEDTELADIAKQCGVSLINRPAELAEDTSSSNSVVEHLLDQIDADRNHYQHFTLLQVTSPLRNAEDIQKAEKMMQTGDYDSVISAYAETKSHPAKMYRLIDGAATSIAPEMEYQRRQDLPEIYRRNGAIFACRTNFFVQTGKLWGGKMGIIAMPYERSVDIDSAEDLTRAREILANS